MPGLTNILNIYALVNDDNRASLWLHLNNHIRSMEGCWLLIGDFNEIRYKHERFSNRGCDTSMEQFNSFIRDSNLFEFSLGGRKFTWINKDDNVLVNWIVFLIVVRLWRNGVYLR